MTEIIKWGEGLNDYKQFTLEVTDRICNFSTELVETEFEMGRNIDAIFYDHLKNRGTKTVEVLYSGGMDSELVLSSCLRNKIPIEAITLRIIINGALLNAGDLYYAERFCRQHDIKQTFFDLDAVDFFQSGKYLEYLVPLRVAEPHIASHFWLLDKCNSFPVIGGDWPWVQMHKANKVLSPSKYAFNAYCRYMDTKGMTGIGNMIDHSFESSYYFIDKHIKEHQTNEDSFYTVPFLKKKMYDATEPRIKSYGWEACPRELLNLSTYRIALRKQVGNPFAKIIWGDKIKALLETNTNVNAFHE